MKRFIRRRGKSETSKLTAKLVLAFNAYIRARDRFCRCISCGTGPVDHAGHFYSTSQCPQPSMRFSERNVNGQCTTCNSFREGNRQGYIKGLLKKYGPEILEELEIMKSFKQNPWTPFEYKTMIKHYQEKLKALS